MLLPSLALLGVAQGAREVHHAGNFLPTGINRPATSIYYQHPSIGAPNMDSHVTENPRGTRRGLLQCMVWAGTGIVWSVAGGVPRGLGLGGQARASPRRGFSFVQISDTHIGFKAEANPDPNATLQQALDRIA